MKVQFFMVLFHSISALVYDCGYPKLIASGLILHSAIFIVLFTNFYIQAYKKDKPRKPVESCNNNNNGYIANGHAKINGHTTATTETNGRVENGYTNGHIVTEKEKVQ